MTVCIAAMARGLWKDNKEYPVIIGASDRMITAGDVIEYEPPTSKIHRITPFIVALVADDLATQAVIVSSAKSYFSNEKAIAPRFFSVEEVANLYSQILVNHISKVVERTVLEPMGLNWESYHCQYPKHDEQIPRWYEDRMNEVFGQESLNTETIIAGVDESGAHIYEIDRNGQIICQDLSGYATIGIGSVHANSQFMFENHSPIKSYEETLFLTYLAKRHAEVAPGVGRNTDLFAISLKGGYFELIEEHNALKRVYESILKKTAKEKNKLKTLIPKILEEVQEERRAKWEKEWEEKEKKFAASKGTLADVQKYLGIKSISKITVGTPES